MNPTSRRRCPVKSFARAGCSRLPEPRDHQVRELADEQSGLPLHRERTPAVEAATVLALDASGQEYLRRQRAG